ncbi:MAG: hypothetical protein MMC33_008706 [Icmadophila ericetorum]|nr:hypothetical protein [Icmadophila ericetorum]
MGFALATIALTMPIGSLEDLNSKRTDHPADQVAALEKRDGDIYVPPKYGALNKDLQSRDELDLAERRALDELQASDLIERRGLYTSTSDVRSPEERRDEDLAKRKQLYGGFKNGAGVN